MEENKPILELNDIWKVYPNGVVANRGISLKVHEGEIHALLGENGAGKSTLMKILFGLEQPTSGSIHFRGQPIQIHSPHNAISRGIGMVHQHFMLVPSLTVAENVVLGMEPKKGLSVDVEKAFEMVENASKTFGLPVPAAKKVKDISVGMRQRVEIVKTLIRGADLIILDEPTAVLTPQETVELFDALRNLVEMQKTVIFITHKLKEVKQIADRITVLRRGFVVDNALVKDVSERDMSRMMVGRDVELTIEKGEPQVGKELLRLEKLNFTRADGVQAVRDLSFKLRAGEILGIAGVEGNGQTEMVQMITGILSPDEGNVFLEERLISGQFPGQIRPLGMSHIPSDRMTRGCALDTTIEENLVSDRFTSPEFSSMGRIKVRQVTHFAHEMIDRFDIRTDGPKTTIRMLSGGNIQKVVVAREFTAGACVIVADQPTRGIDVAAADFIRRQLVLERDRGVGVLLVSADLTELLEASDRIIVMFHGQAVAHFTRIKDINETILGEYMLGIKKMTPEEMGDL